MLLQDRYEARAAAARASGQWPDRFFVDIEDEILEQRILIGATAWSVSPWERVEIIHHANWRRLSLSGPWCIIIHRAGQREMIAYSESWPGALDLADALCCQPWHPVLHQSRSAVSPESLANLDRLIDGAHKALEQLRATVSPHQDGPLVLPPYGMILLAVLATARDSIFGAIAGLRREAH